MAVNEALAFLAKVRDDFEVEINFRIGPWLQDAGRELCLAGEETEQAGGQRACLLLLHLFGRFSCGRVPRDRGLHGFELRYDLRGDGVELRARLQLGLVVDDARLHLLVEQAQSLDR